MRIYTNSVGIHLAPPESGGNMIFRGKLKLQSHLLVAVFFSVGLISPSLQATETDTAKKLKKLETKGMRGVSSSNLASNSPDGYSFLVDSDDSLEPAPATGQSDTVELVGEDPETADQKARKKLSELVQKANTNPETSVAITNEEKKSGGFNPENGISNGSIITYHDDNMPVCIESNGGKKPDGANCKTWRDSRVSGHGQQVGDASDLEKGIYGLWEKAKDNIKDGVYRIWNVALRAGHNLLDEFGRLNEPGLAKYELNEEATQAATELGTRSAERALTIVMGDDRDNSGEEVSPPPEVLRAMAVNITRAIANHAVSQWTGIQVAKKGVEVLVNNEMNAENYKGQVESEENETHGEERLQAQAPLDIETQGTPLEMRTELAQAMKGVSTSIVNPTVQGDEVKPGDPESESVSEWAYRATREQLENPFMNADQIQRPQDIQLSQGQVTRAMDVVTEDENGGNLKVETQNLTPRDQIESYNRQLEIAARSSEEIASESSAFVNNGKKIRSYKLGPGESVLSINDLTPAQKQSLEPGSTALAENPNTKVVIPKASAQLTITKF